MTEMHAFLRALTQFSIAAKKANKNLELKGKGSRKQYYCRIHPFPYISHVVWPSEHNLSKRILEQSEK